MDLVNYYPWINCTHYKVPGLIIIILFLKHHTIIVLSLKLIIILSRYTKLNISNTPRLNLNLDTFTFLKKSHD